MLIELKNRKREKNTILITDKKLLIQRKKDEPYINKEKDELNIKNSRTSTHHGKDEVNKFSYLSVIYNKVIVQFSK